jgi:hexosaminidase
MESLYTSDTPGDSSMNDLILLPKPKSLKRSEDFFSLSDRRLIVIDHSQPAQLWFTAKQIQAGLLEHSGLHWEITAGKGIPENQIGLILSIEQASDIRPQGYKLVCSKDGIRLSATNAAGIFYGALTFIQIIQQQEINLPDLTISDWPDYENRGVMLDISRDKVPTMDTLYRLIELLASWKINHLQLYTEHTFAYRNHPDVWADASPVTGEEILALDAFCNERFIDLVPNQNSFGHMNRWLKLEKYQHLAESPDGFKLYNLFDMGPETLNPIDPQSLEFLESLYDELLPHFSSSWFNVGLDETFELGEGRSKEVVSQTGKNSLYLDFLLKINQRLKSRGKRLMFWGDVLIKSPDLLKEVPEDCAALIWGYEAAHPFEKQSKIMADNGVPFYVCPGTSSWRSLSGRTENAMANILCAAESGLKHGAIGLLNTDWGDRGHWQPLPVSYPGFAYGAAVSWSCENNRDIDLGTALSKFAFTDSENLMGQVVMDFGGIHQETGCEAMNSTILFNILNCSAEKAIEMIGTGNTGITIDDVIAFMFDPAPAESSTEEENALPPQLIMQAFWGEFYKLDENKLDLTSKKIDSLMVTLNQTSSLDANFEKVRQEYSYIASMLRHACKRGKWILDKASQEDNLELRRVLLNEIDDLIDEHQIVWQLRNRTGGLEDSLAGLKKLKSEYMNT